VLHPLIRSLGIESRVRWQGFVDDAALARLYRQATALVLPSLIEGFGYPIVEAMQAGTAVIASNRSGCAEVAGEAALLVDPFSVEAIRGALTAVRRDATLRERLVGLGAVRCKQFSCAAMAQAYVRVLLAAARHTPEDFRT
jgi:glycosyltransferase involved in cell wall biosynthesis